MSQVPDHCTMVHSDHYVSQAAAKAHEAVGPCRHVSWRLLLAMAREKVALPYFPGVTILSALPVDQKMMGLGQRMQVWGTQSYHTKGFPPSPFGQGLFPLQILP